MGGRSYYYFVDYQSDADAALQTLRQREFEAGRYNPAEPFPEFPLGPYSPAPGARHTSIEEARKAAADGGTRSILDIDRIASWPDEGAAAPFAKDLLLDYFRTLQPAKEAVLSHLFDLLKLVEQGQCLYLIVSKDGRLSELFFAGCSYD